jgi:GDP-L-fucose synthase
MKVLVTGAYGLVGTSLQTVVELESVTNHNFVYVSRKQCDFRNAGDVDRLFQQHQPDVVVHLCAKVGGVYDNMSDNYTFLKDNLDINMNVVNACKKYGIRKLINVLSTCIFPDKRVTYPLTSDQLHGGLPHDSNIGYAYSKRVLHVASNILADTSNTQVINLIPTNLFGCWDNYNITSGHVIPSLIHKAYLAKENGIDFQILGTGEAIRQFLYADDLSRVIIRSIDCNEHHKLDMIVSPPESEEISIKCLVDKIVEKIGFTGRVTFDRQASNGQLRKTTQCEELLEVFPDFKFTPIDRGLEKAISFFERNYSSIRK